MSWSSDMVAFLAPEPGICNYLVGFNSKGLCVDYLLPRIAADYNSYESLNWPSPSLSIFYDFDAMT